MIELRYIGRKAWAVDPVGGTPTVWDGPGDIQGVSVAAARKILRHPDEWELANPSDVSRLDVNTAHTTTDEDGHLVEVDDADLTKPVDKMSRAEMKVYVKTKFGRDVSASMSRAHLIDQIEELEKTVNPVNSMRADLDETPKEPEAPTA